MTIIAAFIYRDGQRQRSVDIHAPDGLAMDAGEFAWIGLCEPSDEELAVLQQRFALHPLAVEDARKARQMPKVDLYGDRLFVVARTAHLERDQIAYGETDIFVGRDHIITIRHGSARSHSALRQQLEASPAALRHGPDFILHAVLDFIVDGYFPVVETIEDEVLAMERHALDAFLSRAEINRIFGLRRQIMKFRRILGPMEQVAGRLEHHDLPCIDPEVRLYFRDVRDHVHRVTATTEALRDVLSSVFEVSSLLEQQRQGAITRQLAAWAAILAMPTAIAGIYGMNFDVMPELRWAWGYPAVLAVIAVACGTLYWRFRRAGWL